MPGNTDHKCSWEIVVKLTPCKPCWKDYKVYQVPVTSYLFVRITEQNGAAGSISSSEVCVRGDSALRTIPVFFLAESNKKHSLKKTIAQAKGFGLIYLLTGPSRHPLHQVTLKQKGCPPATATTLEVHSSFSKTFPKAFVTFYVLWWAVAIMGVLYTIVCCFYLSEPCHQKKILAQEKDIMKTAKVGPKKV